MSAPAITIRNLTKRHRLGIRETYPMLRETLAAGALASWRWLRSTRRGESGAPCIQALDGIDLDVVEGEVLGIVGRNGAGKSTLLKILAGITEPSTGYAEIRGRVGSLLEVGTGFHWELTGRENIYMNGALLGMRRREIDHKFDDIVAFSEVEAFLDTPVKRYSSGMYMRLAFAVAAHLEPDVLIVDEVLAVGDLVFQKKCLGRMSTIAHEGRTVLFVSHNMASVQSLCSRAVLLDRGKVVGDGAPRDVIGRYVQAALVHDPLPLGERKDRIGDGSARMTSVRIESTDPDGVIRSTSRLRITIGYTSGDPIRFARFVAMVRDVNGTGLFALDSGVTGGLPEDLPAVGFVTCVTDPIHLTPGRCHLTLRLQRGAIDADCVRPAAEFDVESDDFFGTGKEPTRESVVGLLKHAWSSGGASPPDGAVRDLNGTTARILDE